MKNIKLTISIALISFVLPKGYGQTLDTNYFNDLKSAKSTSSNTINWQQVGPGNSGYCDAFFIHPTDDNTMFMFPDLDNAYLSSNDGETWETLKDSDGDGDYLRESTAIDFSRQNPDLGYVIDVRGRMLKTTNRGKDWLLVNNFPATSRLASLSIDPKNANIIYVGGGDFFNVKDNHRTKAILDNRDLNYRYPYAEYGVIYKTTNGGTTWTTIRDNGLPRNADIGKIIINPKATSILTLATSHGVFLSTNSGVSWEKKGTGLPNNMPRDMVARLESGVHTLYCIDQTSFVATGSGVNRSINSVGGVYKSINNGENWTNVSGDLGIDLTKINNNSSLINRYYSVVALWFGISVQNARTTYPKLPTKALPVFNRIVVDPRNDTRIYITHNSKHDYSFGAGDVWSTNNSGVKWSPILRSGNYWNSGNDDAYWSTKGNVGSNATFAHIQTEIDRTGETHGNRFLGIDSRGYVYASVDQQTLRSTDDGLNWYQRDDMGSANGWKGRGDSNLPGRAIVLETGRDGIYLFSSGEHGLWQSASQTAPLYLKQIEGQVNHQGSTSIASVAVHPTNPDIIYTMQFRQDHRGELRKTINGGATWSTVSNPLPTTGTNVSTSDQILNHSLTIDYANPANIYFNTIGSPINEVFGTAAPFSSHGVYKSTNSGTSFSRINGSGAFQLPANGTTVNRIKIDPTSPNILYAACVLKEGTPGGLYRTTNRGNKWEKVTIPSEIKSVNNIHIQKTAGKNVLFISCGSFEGAANEGGVWKSTDNGMNWIKIFDLPYVWYTEVSTINPNIITVAAGAQNVKKASLNVLNPGAYISFDGGSTWIKANNNLGQPHKVLEVRPDPKNEKVFWCTLQGSGWARGVYNGAILSDTLNLDPTKKSNTVLNETVKLYPNPIRDNATISGLQIGDKVIVYDFSGNRKLQFKAKLENEVVDFSTLKEGTYFVSINGNKGIQVIKKQ
ncbi:T9SS type A sorting domain-containing protein [Flavobacterium sp. PL002]|uniref:T9SS type A sorting domain-containing protein n=1 Tax=Flavobacterium sp. PL002 TaxID=1897058 RepID=UPI0017877CE2|nr:T9SS type A sorting domain-containing protein [Flavobacterium sp. PL002]MBE0393674.1 Xyloglucanase Xgh74A [Flavobacterium sp. PL002]